MDSCYVWTVVRDLGFLCFRFLAVENTGGFIIDAAVVIHVVIDVVLDVVLDGVLDCAFVLDGVLDVVLDDVLDDVIDDVIDVADGDENTGALDSNGILKFKDSCGVR